MCRLYAGNLAGALMEVGDVGRAEPLLREAIEGMTAHVGAQNPKTLQLKYNLAVFLSKGGRYDEASTVADEVAAGRLRALGSDNPMTQNALSLAENIQGKLSSPMQRPAGWEIGPARLYAIDLVEQADSHAQSGDFGNMLACARAACTADASFCGGFFLAGSALAAQFKRDEALAELERALRVARPEEAPRVVELMQKLEGQATRDPDCARAQAERLCDQADTYGKQHRVEDMLATAERATVLDPTYFGGYAIRGRVLASRGQSQAALEDFEIAYDLATADGVFQRGERDFGVSGFLPQLRSELANGRPKPSVHQESTSASIAVQNSGPDFNHGDRVQIHGLRGAPQHNGKYAVVQNFDSQTGRYVVQADVDGKPMKIKPANLNACN